MIEMDEYNLDGMIIKMRMSSSQITAKINVLGKTYFQILNSCFEAFLKAHVEVILKMFSNNVLFILQSFNIPIKLRE